MIVIIASRFDHTAQQLALHWAAHDARVLTCADLSTVGWRYQVGASEQMAVIGGEIVSDHAISGVLVRLQAITEHELPHIAPEDRAYVAAEMTAFLRAWLAGLHCPVLNRPTAGGLAGPNWRLERWLHTAAQLGMPVRPVQRRTGAALDVSADNQEPLIDVTVVGDQCYGASNHVLAQRALQLAKVAGIEFLTVSFSSDPDSLVVAAHAWPEITSLEIAHAIADYLLRGVLC